MRPQDFSLYALDLLAHTRDRQPALAPARRASAAGLVIILVYLGLVGLLVAGWAPVAAADDGFCWRDSYGRGVGTVPTQCPAGQESDGGLLCYDECAPGYEGVLSVCWQRCPVGYIDDGALCRRDAEIISADMSQCEWYEGCSAACSRCPAGYINDGCTCRKDAHIFAKHSYIRDLGDAMMCSSELEYDAGLCYDECDGDYGGVGPVCWGGCPQSHPVECGLGCAESQDACAEAVTDQVLSVLESVLSITSAIVTAGGSTAVTTSTKLAGSLTANVSKTTTKSILKSLAQEMGQGIAEGTLDAYAQATVEAGTTGTFDPEVLTSLDPTGIASIITAYAKPVCSAGDPAGSLYPRATQGGWTGFAPSWDSTRPVTAVVHIPHNDKVYTFSGDAYVRHTFGQGPDAGYPRKIADGWTGWPSQWDPARGIDAIVYIPDNDKIYTFSRDEYVRHTFGQSPDAGYPVKTYLGWTGFPDSWSATRPLSAAVYAPNGKVYTFSGADYVRNTFGSGPD